MRPPSNNQPKGATNKPERRKRKRKKRGEQKIRD
jgi:hypothetical protein